MKRERESQYLDSMLDIGEPIGHITTPIEDEDLQRVLTVLKRHGVDLRKIRSPDNWWLLLLPEGAVKTKKEVQGKVITSTIWLPNGFSFLLEEGIFNFDRNYAIPPKISVEEGSDDVWNETCYTQ